MAEFNVRWEKFNNLRLSDEELRIFKKLLGGLSCTIAEQQLDLTPDEYQITYDIYNLIDNEEG